MKIKKLYRKGCNPCTMVAIILKEIEKEYNIELEEIEMSNSKVEDEMIELYDLENVPTLIFYEDDIEVWRLEGYISKEQITNIINHK